jgi:hypothetical protein
MPRLLLLGLLCALLLPAAASASATHESAFQDDNSLIFNTPAGTAKTLDTLAELGVERIRVSVFWATVAPKSDSRDRPAFDASDPGAYPLGSWERYDQVLRLALARGIGVNFNITSPAPLWATGAAPREDIANTFRPDPVEFGRFVQAVGRRYSGSYRPPLALPAPPEEGACRLLGTCTPPSPVPTGEPLPRVGYFSIWNEPNQPGWLTPQWDGNEQSGFVEASPRIYRGLVDAAWTALAASGHGADTILIGETAPKGLDVRGTTRAMKALRFVRQLYCVDDKLVPYAGEAARVRGCEAPADFAAAHPALFGATGYAHHPYELVRAPDSRPKDPDFVTTANLARLSSTLQRVYGAKGKPKRPPLFLTEFGYNTSPPNPAGVSLRRQAAYLDHAEFLATENREVRTHTQFLLVDDAPRPGRNGVTVGYGATFQTGLLFLDGKPKPSFAAYKLPVHLPRASVRRGRTLRVWGLVRPARRIGKRQRVVVELRVGGRTRTLRTLTTRPGRGLVDARVRIPASGSLRLRWRDPRSGRTVRSRAVDVRVRR